MNFDALLLGAKKVKASDIHMMEDSAPFFRINGDLKKVDVPPISGKELQEILRRMMPHHLMRELESQRGCDFSYQLGTEIRFRCVAFYSMGKLGIVMRLIPLTIPTIEDLQLPEVLRTVARNPRGMVLLTGMTGSGKSTTLAAMLDHVNKNEYAHILSVEDPIEFVHTSQKCLINQREVHRDTHGFNEALRAALREDPDYILVGEMRDIETIRLALTAAETGHLVFATLHTSSAAKTVDRIIDVFPAGEKPMVRSMLSESLRAVISQSLLKKVGGGRIAAHEIMVGIPAIRNLIREDKVAQMYSAIQTGAQYGMQTLDQCLLDLVKRGLVTRQQAIGYAKNKESFK